MIFFVLLDRFTELVENIIKMAQKEDMRETIVNAGSDIFARFGYRKTTMDDIAQAIGKGKSSLYYYFKSKDEVFKAVVEKEVLQLSEFINKKIAAEDNPEEQLRIYVKLLMTCIADRANFYDVMKNDVLRNIDFIDEARIRYKNQVVENIQNILTNGVNKKLFKLEDTRLAAIAISTAIDGVEVPLVTEESSISLNDRVDHLLNILFFGIIKR